MATNPPPEESSQTHITNRSGGVDIDASNVEIGGDAVGRDKIVNVTIINQASAPSELKSLFLVPFPHNPDFVGRDADLAALHEMLRQGNSPVGIRPTVLVGLGGIGKTQLAVEYAHAHRADYPGGVFWLNAVNPLLLEFAKLAEELDLADRDTPRDKAARKAWDYLDAHPESLVIFDNVVEPAELNVPFSPDLIPANLRCRTLFTTRQRDFPRTFQPFEVKVLPEMAAMRLLLRHDTRQGVLNPDHPEHGYAGVICVTLGYLPLALELAAAFLGKYPDISLRDYRVRLLDEGVLATVDDTELRPEDMPTRHEIAVHATLQTSWKQVTDEDARQAFLAAGQLREAEMIPIPRLGLLAGLESDAKPGHPAPLVRVLITLRDLSLIEELTSDRLRLHPLVQEFAARLSPPAFRLELAARVATALNDLPRLQTRVVRYGIDLVLEDVRTGLGFCTTEPESETYPRLSSLERVLDRQAHHLRGWDAEAQPAFFLQQLRNESFQLGLGELQTRAEAELVERRLPYILHKIKVSCESPELVRTLAGHSNALHGVALSADGRLAVSASGDKTLKVWEVATGRELRTLQGHSHEVSDVALSADGRLAVSASYDQTLKVWDVATGRELRTFAGHGGVLGVALSTDGRLAASASMDQTLKVWDVATGRELHTLQGHSSWVTSVALSADGRLAVSASRDKTLKVWDVATGRELRTLQGHNDEVSDVALSADGRLAISASRDKTLKVWDVAMGHVLRTLQGHSPVALSADGRLAVSASQDKTYEVWEVADKPLKLWDVATGRELHTLAGHNISGVCGVALSVDGRLAVSASQDKTLKVWDISVSLLNLPIPMQVGVTASDRRESHERRAWEADNAGVPTGRELCMLQEHSREVNGVALSADGRLAVSASNDKTLKVWEVETGRELRTLHGHSNYVEGVALSADGRVAVSASRDETLKVWDVATGRTLRTLQGHSNYVEGVALSADGRVAVSASRDKTLKVWDVTTGRVLRTLQGHSPLALSADGRLAVSESQDRTYEAWEVANNLLKLWNVATGRALRTLKERWVKGMALSADGRLAVSVSEDRTLKVWEVATGQVVATFLNSAPLKCCAITPDGKTIITGDYIGRVHFLELVGVGEIQVPEIAKDQEEVETRSDRWPRWLKGLLRQRGR